VKHTPGAAIRAYFLFDVPWQLIASTGAIRDLEAASVGKRIRFTSAILPLLARRTRSLASLLPMLYLRGISTGISTRPCRRR
jgi:hypothetical protein